MVAFDAADPPQPPRRPGVGSVAALIRERRAARNWNQTELAHAVGKSKGWIGVLETGGELPSFGFLVELHAALFEERDPDAEGALAVWIISWLQEKAARSNGATSIELQRRIEKALSRAGAAMGAGTTAGRSLADFPLGFHPLAIICGDRREDPAQSRGDIFIRQMAVTDFRFMMGLDLPASTQIFPDKLVRMKDEDFLKRTFGRTNLLVVGSPASNWAARHINNRSIFRFDIPRALTEWDERLRSEGQLKDRPTVELFWDLAKGVQGVVDTHRIRAADDATVSRHIDEALSQSDPQLRDLLSPRMRDEARTPKARLERVAALLREVLTDGLMRDPHYWMEQFRKPGIIDAVTGTVYGRADYDEIQENNDFGLVSIAVNPFADDDAFLCIFAAGVHGPGTAHAVSALAQGECAHMPLGGVLEVSLDVDLPWGERIASATHEWKTPQDYSAAVVLANLTASENVTKNLTPEERRACVELVSRLGERMSLPSTAP